MRILDALGERIARRGPGDFSLFAVVGRKASGITWTPDRLDAYITAPKKRVPGAGAYVIALSLIHVDCRVPQGFYTCPVLLHHTPG